MTEEDDITGGTIGRADADEEGYWKLTIFCLLQDKDIDVNKKNPQYDNKQNLKPHMTIAQHTEASINKNKPADKKKTISMRQITCIKDLVQIFQDDIKSITVNLISSERKHQQVLVCEELQTLRKQIAFQLGCEHCSSSANEPSDIGHITSKLLHDDVLSRKTIELNTKDIIIIESYSPLNVNARLFDYIYAMGNHTIAANIAKANLKITAENCLGFHGIGKQSAVLIRSALNDMMMKKQQHKRNHEKDIIENNSNSGSNGSNGFSKKQKTKEDEIDLTKD